jgi:hypothetical protein
MPPPASASIDSDVLNRTGITIPAKNWEASKAWINRPAETNQSPKIWEISRQDVP